MNLYRYADGDPVNRTDPTGLVIADAIVFCHFFPEVCDEVRRKLFPDDDNGDGGLCVEAEESVNACDLRPRPAGRTSSRRDPRLPRSRGARACVPRALSVSRASAREHGLGGDRRGEAAARGAAPGHYEYDKNGNRTKAEYPAPAAARIGVYDAQDRLETYGPWTFAYTPAR